MIQSIYELQEYLLKDANGFDELKMTSPGCSKEEIKRLKDILPGLPESYISPLETLNLNGIAVGWFEVSPLSLNPKGMAANLIEGNEEGVLFSEYARFYHLYSVATTDGYGIFVATTSSPFKEGEIILIDESIYADKENPEQWIYKLAKNFEQFLIVAGNLNQLNREIIQDASKYVEKKEEFLERLKILNVDEEYHRTWLQLF